MSTRFVKNFGHHLIKSMTLSVGDSHVKVEEGYYCPNCNHYEKTNMKCPIILKRYNDDKLLSYVIRRTNGIIHDITNAYMYVNDMGLTYDDFEDEEEEGIVETYVCQSDMVYKPEHFVDQSVILDEIRPEYVAMFNSMSK